MNSTKKIKHFPGLDGLRFFAALAVILGHVELIKAGMGLNNLYKESLRLNLGGLGVYFFFVLSGFLITYLLLREKQEQHHISLKNFYLRRIFRIWPLYFLILVLGFFILPEIHIMDLPYYKKHFEQNYFPNLILYLLIIPNLAFAIYPAVPHIGQSWSIGVEEQFYIFWPILIKKSKNTGRLIIMSFVIYLTIKILVLMIFIGFPELNWLLYLKNFLSMCKFESMMIGAYGAWVLFSEKEKLLKFIYRQEIFYASLIGFPIINYIFFEGIIQDGIHIVLSIQFIIIILNISTNPNCKIMLKGKLINYLGKISYGLYMYHLMLIPLIIYLFKLFFAFNGNSLFINILIYTISVIAAITVSHISYNYFEKYFLRIKSRFETK